MGLHYCTELGLTKLKIIEDTSHGWRCPSGHLRGVTLWNKSSLFPFLHQSFPWFWKSHHHQERSSVKEDFQRYPTYEYFPKLTNSKTGRSNQIKLFCEVNWANHETSFSDEFFRLKNRRVVSDYGHATPQCQQNLFYTCSISTKKNDMWEDIYGNYCQNYGAISWCFLEK